MIFLINSSYHLWLPFYIFNGHEYRHPIFAIFIILETLISVFCVYFTVKLCQIIWRIRVFHVNMSILAVAYILQYVECFVGKSLIKMHQSGIWHIPDVPPDTTFMNWWTDDADAIPPIRSPNDIVPMLIGGFLIWHYLYSMIGFIFSFCVERALATLLSGNYEKHRRTYISVLILATSHSTTLYLSWSTFNEHVQFVPTVIGCMICVSISCVLFIVILLINLKIDKVQSSTGSNHVYTLAFRFQVKENIKALKLAYRIILCIGIYIFLNCIVLFTIFFNIFPRINSFLIYLLENCIYLNPLLICSVVGFSIAPWKKALLAELPATMKLWLKSSESQRGTSRVSASDQDIYFSQLQSSWLQRRKEMRPSGRAA